MRWSRANKNRSLRWGRAKQSQPSTKKSRTGRRCDGTERSSADRCCDGAERRISNRSPLRWSRARQTQTGTDKSRTECCHGGTERSSADRCRDGAEQSGLDRCYGAERSITDRCDSAEQRSIHYHLVASFSQPIGRYVNLSQNSAIGSVSMCCPTKANHAVCMVVVLPLELATIRRSLHVLRAHSIRLSSYSFNEPIISQSGCRTQFVRRSLAIPLSRDVPVYLTDCKILWSTHCSIKRVARNIEAEVEVEVDITV